MLLDTIDQKLIIELQKDGRVTSSNLSKKLGISIASVSRRIKGLLRDNVISITAMPEPSEIGLNSMAIIALDVTMNQIDNVCEQLVRNRSVHFTALTFGRFDIIVNIYAASPEMLVNIIKNEIAAIDGVRHVETFYIAELKKQTFDWLLENEISN
jgi:Lrp/AsnC family transcriptional regulator for asnA, asnC and gidA